MGPCLRMRWHFWKGWSGKKWGLVCEPSHTECLRVIFVVWRLTVMVLECLRATECLLKLTADAEYHARKQLFHVWKKKYPESTGHNYTLKWTIIICIIFVEKQHRLLEKMIVSCKGLKTGQEALDHRPACKYTVRDIINETLAPVFCQLTNLSVNHLKYTIPQ